jgi:hypothetical protein
MYYNMNSVYVLQINVQSGAHEGPNGVNSLSLASWVHGSGYYSRENITCMGDYLPAKNTTVMVLVWIHE